MIRIAAETLILWSRTHFWSLYNFIFWVTFFADENVRPDTLFELVRVRREGRACSFPDVRAKGYWAASAVGKGLTGGPRWLEISTNTHYFESSCQCEQHCKWNTNKKISYRNPKWAGFWNIGSFSKIFTYTIKKIVAALKVLVSVAGETFNHAETSLYECLGYICEAFVRQAPNSGWVRADWKSRDRISMEIHWIAVISLYVLVKENLDVSVTFYLSIFNRTYLSDYSEPVVQMLHRYNPDIRIDSFPQG